MPSDNVHVPPCVQALNDAGLQASATRFSVVPLDAAQPPEPDVDGGGTVVSPAGSPSASSGKRKSGGVNAAGVPSIPLEPMMLLVQSGIHIFGMACRWCCAGTKRTDDTVDVE